MIPPSRGSHSRPDALCVVDVLGDRHRNHVLRLLRQHGAPMSLDTLAERVDASDADSDSGESVAAPRQTAVQLHHTHLPKLADAELLDYDRDSRTVVRFDEERLDALLETGQRLLESLRQERPRNDGRSR